MGLTNPTRFQICDVALTNAVSLLFDQIFKTFIGCNRDDNEELSEKCLFCDQETWREKSKSCPISLPGGGSIAHADPDRLKIGAYNSLHCPPDTYIKPAQIPPLKSVKVTCQCVEGRPKWMVTKRDVKLYKQSSDSFEVEGCSDDQCQTDDECRLLSPMKNNQHEKNSFRIFHFKILKFTFFCMSITVKSIKSK